MAVSGRAGKPARMRIGGVRSGSATATEIRLPLRNTAENGRHCETNPLYIQVARRSRSASIGNIQMKKIVLSFAAVALLAGFAAGCAKDEPKPTAPIVRKG